VDDLIQLRASGCRATVDVARGGRLASLIVGERELLVPAPDREDRSLEWGCFLMAPWPGRLAGGRVAWRDGLIHLRTARGPDALHGVVYDRRWTVDRAEADQAVLSCAFDPAAWPLGGRVRQRLRLAADKLELHAVITAGRRAMPAALGWHPWFRRTGGEPRLLVAATRVLQTRRMIPTGRTIAVAGVTDLRAGPWLGARRLDHTYVEPRPPVVATWPDLELRVEFSRTTRALVVFTPPGGLCVEPQTAWPDALGTMDARYGARVLEPGRTLRATMRLRWRVIGAA